MTDTRFVLYVNRDKSNVEEFGVGSQCCMDSFKQMDSSVITVQDLSVLQRNKVELPRWIDGAPILVDRSTSSITKGTEAIQNLQRAARRHPQPKATAPEKHLDSLLPPQNDSVEDKGSVTQSELDEYIARRNMLNLNSKADV